MPQETTLRRPDFLAAKKDLTHPRIQSLRRAEPKTRGCCLLPLSNRPRPPCAPRGLTLVSEPRALKAERDRAMHKIRFSISDFKVDWKSKSTTAPRGKPRLVSKTQVWMVYEVMRRRKNGAIDAITAPNGLSRSWLNHWMSQHAFLVEFVSIELERLVYRFLLL